MKIVLVYSKKAKELKRFVCRSRDTIEQIIQSERLRLGDEDIVYRVWDGSWSYASDDEAWRYCQDINGPGEICAW